MPGFSTIGRAASAGDSDQGFTAKTFTLAA